MARIAYTKVATIASATASKAFDVGSVHFANSLPLFNSIVWHRADKSNG